MVFFQQIVGILIVNLHETDVHVEFELFSGLKLIEELSEHSRDDSSLTPTFSSTDVMSLATPSLSICKDSSIVSFQTTRI